MTTPQETYAELARAVAAQDWRTVESLAKSQQASEPIGDACFSWAGPAELFAFEPPIPFLCRALDLAPGPVTMFGGYGYSGKTMMAQALALAICTGRPVWGALEARQGRVRHLDYEQGWPVTKRRYLALAAGLGITQRDLGELASGEYLTINRKRGPKLTDARMKAGEGLSRYMRGYDLLIVDALRSSTDVDENDSRAAELLHDIGAHSEATGCAVILIHHARKSSKDGDPREAIRGHSSLFDACQSVIVAHTDADSFQELPDGSGYRTTAFVVGTKARITIPFPRHELLIQSDKAMERTTMSAKRDDGKEKAPPQRTRSKVDLTVVAEKIMLLIRRDGACNKNALSLNIGVSGSTITAALATLMDSGQLKDLGGLIVPRSEPMEVFSPNGA